MAVLGAQTNLVEEMNMSFDDGEIYDEDIDNPDDDDWDREVDDEDDEAYEDDEDDD